MPLNLTSHPIKDSFQQLNNIENIYVYIIWICAFKFNYIAINSSVIAERINSGVILKQTVQKNCTVPNTPYSKPVYSSLNLLLQMVT